MQATPKMQVKHMQAKSEASYKTVAKCKLLASQIFFGSAGLSYTSVTLTILHSEFHIIFNDICLSVL